MKLLYVTYIDFDGSGKSGSSVRPQKMYKAFLKLGLDVKLLECQQNKFKERRKKVREILEWLDNNTPDICYIESPSGPIFNQIDLKLIKKVHKMGVPIGYFLRDAFWKFPILQKGNPVIKKVVINSMCRRDIHTLIRNCDIIYFPTRSFAKLFNLKKIKSWDTLPPAADIEETTMRLSQKTLKKNCIYVGGVSLLYGSDILVEAFKRLNIERTVYNLILICREKEYKDFFKETNKYSWLKVVHVSGEDLKKYYLTADVGIIPIRKTGYSNIGISVKTFEYLGYGLPIISTNTAEMGKFVSENKVGIVCEDNPESLANAIEKIFSCDNGSEMLRNVENVAQKNSWECRAKQVIDELMKLKDEKN